MELIQKDDLQRLAVDFAECSPLNYLTMDQALRPELAGLRLYAEPILGYASAADPMFAQLQKPGVIGPHFSLPRSWLPGCETVLSFFLPFTDAVKKANRLNPVWPADEWLHARIEGHRLVNALSGYLRDLLSQAGYPSVSPSLDARFWSNESTVFTSKPGYTSNWSERHVAHVCGLGTFGLSAGLITRKGIAGRFGSLVTVLSLPPDKRPYRAYNEYCTHCGACLRRCPVRAITSVGKLHTICGPFVEETRRVFSPRYGCGKCQVAVPCESGIPSAKRKIGSSIPPF